MHWLRMQRRKIPLRHLILCACGCGQLRLDKNERYNKFDYIHGHTGHKGGRISDKYGYIRIWNPRHPYADAHGYVLEHRLVMELHLGRYLEPNEVVHHKNRLRYDNRLENLELTTDKEHPVIHFRLDMNERVCHLCGYSGRSHWRLSNLTRHQICHKCWMKEYHLRERAKVVDVNLEIE